MTDPMMYHQRHEPPPTLYGDPGGYELRYSVRGQPFYVWKKPVPRISDMILDCVAYIYPSVNHAQAGEKWGGSGFLVGVPSEVHEDWNYVYCVTNRHVVQPMQSPVVRLNTEDGSNDLIELTPDDWIYHQDGDDLAACPIAFKDPKYYKYSMLHPTMFITKEIIEQQHIGPGDEVYMVGRFVTHQGQQQNTPVARFGNISMADTQLIRNEWGLLQESFLIETRSLSGFSGSPVFLFISPLDVAPAEYGEREPRTWLLGVDWGHMRSFEPVLKKHDDPHRHDLVPVNQEWMVPSNSGQAQVVPAWKLQELLDQEDMRMARRQEDEQTGRWKKESSATFDTHTSDQSDEEHSPFSRDDFFRNLKKVAKKQNQPSQRDSKKR